MSIAPTWHSLCKLREDVKNGTLQEADFAAKLNGVHIGGNTPEVYRNPEKFFSRTFPTLRMKELVRDVFQRLAEKVESRSCAYRYPMAEAKPMP